MSKEFHISDVLSVTTGRLVSYRHMEGIYELCRFLTGEPVFAHQLGRVAKEAEPWLRAQFPYLMPDYPAMAKQLKALDDLLALDGDDRKARETTITAWVEATRHQVKLPESIPEMLPVYEMGADMHTGIDPIEELEAMVGKDRVLPIVLDDEQSA